MLIVVVMIQIFFYVMEVIIIDKVLKGKNFVVIIDEVYNLQIGFIVVKL